jgi:hypothetical protein
MKGAEILNAISAYVHIRSFYCLAGLHIGARFKPAAIPINGYDCLRLFSKISNGIKSQCF